MPWLPEWRVTVGDDVYTTVTNVSYSTGRLDIDRQPTAGYCRVEIVNTTGAAFTINVTEPVTLELKNSAGTYVTVFGGEVSDFNIGVRSPEESGFITTGTILGIGSLSRLSKAIYNTALAEGLDGAQIAAILGAALNLSWAEVTPTLTWATYPATVTWDEAESYIGTIDSGSYTMIAQSASETAKSQTLVDQIATSALGQIYEDRYGNVNYDDADHRSTYLATYGYTLLDGNYASPNTIKSTTQISRIRNSLIYKYGTGYASSYSTSDTDSIASYGLYERSQDSNIKTLANITAIAGRELTLRKTPQGQLETISFRLDNPEMTNAVRDSLIGSFFGQPVSITNLPSNMLGGQFDGFIEDITMKATPTYVDISLYVSPAAFSLPTVYGDYSLAQTYTTDTTFTVPSGVSQIAVLMKAKGGNGQNGSSGSSGTSGSGGTGGGGGAAAAFWDFDVIAGQTYAVAFNTGSTNRVSFGSLMSISAGTDGSAGGSGGGLYSRDGSVVYYDAQTGTPAGIGATGRSTNGNGAAGGNSSGLGTLVATPSNVGLTAIRAGGGGGGGGAGAKDSTGSNFYSGGTGGTGGAVDGNNAGGDGGNALQDGDLAGTNGGSGTLGNGGGGGAGGAYQAGFGNGAGGTGSSGSGAVVYIYTR